MPEIANYLDILLEYNNKCGESAKGRTLSSYFNLRNTYLSFMDSKELTTENGVNDPTTYLLSSNTGKIKMTALEFLKYTAVLRPEWAVTPFEYVLIRVFYVRYQINVERRSF